MMSDQLAWTQKLGDAVLAQQADVMDGIQRLRGRAYANKKLTSTEEQTVSKKSEGSKQVIVIEPTNPETVYVPYYDPAVVYGAWPYPAYAPYYWGAGYWPGGGALLATGFAFGAGYAIGRGAGSGTIGVATSTGPTTTSISSQRWPRKLAAQCRSPARRALQQQRRRQQIRQR